MLSSPHLTLSTTAHFSVLGSSSSLAIMYPRDDPSNLRPSEDLFVYQLLGPSIDGNGITYSLKENKKGGHRYDIAFSLSQRYLTVIVSWTQASGLLKSPHVEPGHLLQHIVSGISLIGQEFPTDQTKSVPSYLKVEEWEIDASKVLERLRELVNSRATAALKIKNKDVKVRLLLSDGEVMRSEMEAGSEIVKGNEVLAKLLYLNGQLKISVVWVDRQGLREALESTLSD